MTVTLDLSGLVDGTLADVADVTVPLLEIQAALNGSTAISPDIDGGTIDGAVIGGATPAAGAFTTLAANAELSLVTSTTALVAVSGAVGNSKGMRVQVGGVDRWFLRVVDNESGSNSGSNLDFYALSDAGANIGSRMKISRGTGQVTIGGDLDLDGALNHDGSTVGFFGTAPATKPTVTGSRGANAALASLLTALAGLGLLTDSSS